MQKFRRALPDVALVLGVIITFVGAYMMGMGALVLVVGLAFIGLAVLTGL